VREFGKSVLGGQPIEPSVKSGMGKRIKKVPSGKTVGGIKKKSWEA